MLRISKLADYATVLMASLAVTPEKQQTALALSQATQLRLPTVAKLLKLLTKAHLLVAQRGVHGGYRLVRPSTEITLSDIVLAIEGQFAVTACSLAQHDCHIAPVCRVKQNWQIVTQKMLEVLSDTRLSDLISSSH